MILCTAKGSLRQTYIVLSLDIKRGMFIRPIDGTGRRILIWLLRVAVPFNWLSSSLNDGKVWIIALTHPHWTKGDASTPFFNWG